MQRRPNPSSNALILNWNVFRIGYFQMENQINLQSRLKFNNIIENSAIGSNVIEGFLKIFQYEP